MVWGLLLLPPATLGGCWGCCCTHCSTTAGAALLLGLMPLLQYCQRGQCVCDGIEANDRPTWELHAAGPVLWVPSPCQLQLHAVPPRHAQCRVYRAMASPGLKANSGQGSLQLVGLEGRGAVDCAVRLKGGGVGERDGDWQFQPRQLHQPLVVQLAAQRGLACRGEVHC